MKATTLKLLMLAPFAAVLAACGGGDDDDGAKACEALSVSDNFAAYRGNGFISVETASSPNVGTAATDPLRIELYASPAGSETYPAGVYELGKGVNANYSTCKQCVLFALDQSGGAQAKLFFAVDGIIEVNDGSNYFFTAGSIENVRLAEVTINNDTSVGTLVPNGDCYKLASTSWSLATSNPPN